MVSIMSQHGTPPPPTSQRIEVRAARPTDAAGIARVYVDSWRSTYPGMVPKRSLLALDEVRQRRAWRRLLLRRAPVDSILVATLGQGEESRIVGFGSCGRARRPSLGLGGEIYTLYVEEDWQGVGIGRGLLTGLFRRLVRGRLDSALIWVLSGNPSRFFYEAMGGKRVAERDEPFAGTVLHEVGYGWSDLPAWLETADLHR